MEFHTLSFYEEYHRLRLPLYTIISLLSAGLIYLRLFRRKRGLEAIKTLKSCYSLEHRKLLESESSEPSSQKQAFYPNHIYKVATDNGHLVILPYQFADEIKNNPDLSFTKFVQSELQEDIPGFQVAKHGQLARKVCQKQLSRHLADVTPHVSDEISSALSTLVGTSTAWKEINSQSMILEVVARASSRVFLGERHCRNKEWLRISTSFTIQFGIAAMALRRVPRPLRRLLHWFVPECKQLRSLVKDAKSFIAPILEERKETKRRAQEHKKAIPQIHDAIDWAEKETDGKNYDPSLFQLALSLAAIHTTTDLLQQVFIDTARNQHIIKPLREEMVSVLRAEGWRKSALHNMKLLDSVVKESQRLKPSSLLSMRRYVCKDICLSDGTTIEKGTIVAVDASRMWDPELYENPMTWDGYRFLKIRSQPGKEAMSQAGSVHRDHTAFGLGHEACPGRLFAIDEVKIALCHLLLKYEWKLVPGTKTTAIYSGTSMVANPFVKVNVRQRENIEFQLD